MNNPYSPPQADITPPDNEPRYAGFWIRTLASLIDTVLLMIIIMPILLALYGKNYFQGTAIIQGPMDLLLSYVFPAIAVTVFWIYRSATPGKMIVKIRIIDVRSGQPPTIGQCIGRYLGYYLSTIFLMLGFLWIAFDPKKQGWHDKLAGTAVIRNSPRK